MKGNYFAGNKYKDIRKEGKGMEREQKEKKKSSKEEGMKGEIKIRKNTPLIFF